jgi:hypothetical protein
MAEGDPDAVDTAASDDPSPTARSPEPDPVDLGVALLERFADDELSVADAITRLESVTTHPRTQRRILDAAVERGVIERTGSRIRPQGSAPIDFERDVITKEGEFSCRRCGTTISTGYFLNLDTGEFGAFGSSCIRMVTGHR